MTFFGLEKGHDLEKQEAHPNKEFPKANPLQGGNSDTLLSGTRNN